MRRLFIGQFLFPPKCAGCRERLDVFDSNFVGDEAFCKSCRTEWEKEKLSACPSCRVAAIECTCRPDILDKKYIDCISLVKFGRTQSVDALIYSLKKRKIAKNFDFASSELAKRLNLRITPKLTFIRDNNTERAMYISRILKDIEGEQ